MSGFLFFIYRVLFILAIIVVAITLWKTGEVFNKQTDKTCREVLAWNMLISLSFLIWVIATLFNM